jgi:hypothetical protein
MMHIPGYAQPQHLVMPDTGSDNHPPPPVARRQNEQPKNKKRKNANQTSSKPAKPTTTSNSEINNEPPPAIVDRVPPGKERRRTQMRIAQRAYRQRKQDEISSRQKQLSERDTIVARMKTAFDSLNSKLVDFDVLSLYPDLSQPVQDMASAFEALAQMATASTAGSTAATTTAQAGNEKAPETDLSSLSGGLEQQQWTNSHAFGNNSSTQQPPSLDITVSSYATTGLTQTFGSQNYSNPFLHEQSRSRIAQANPSQQFIGNDINQYNAAASSSVSGAAINDFTSPIPMYIRPPTSYTFQETTFARRLMRTCIEAANRVLLNGGLPLMSPREARVFKLAYRLWSKEYLAEKFQLALSGGDLFDHSVPFIPLGGAGSHYLHATTAQHQQQPGGLRGPVSGDYPMPVTSGPLTTHTAHIRHDGADTSLNGIVSSLGLLNDEWFDAQDVDRYLQDMGINLEAHSTNYQFLLPANPNVASKRMATTITSIPQSMVATANSAQGVGAGMPEYTPATVNVDQFLNSKIPHSLLSFFLGNK